MLRFVDIHGFAAVEPRLPEVARAFRASELFAGIVLLGLIGFASNVVLVKLERRFLKWQRP